MKRHILLSTLIVLLCTPAGLAQIRTPRPIPPLTESQRATEEALVLSSTATAWMPTPRSNQAVVEWHDRIYCIGGNGYDGATAAGWEFDPYLRRFTDLPPMRQARFGHAAAVCGHCIVVFGGMKDKDILNSMERFDLRTRTWTDAGKMPFARARFGLAVLDGKVYVAGGSDGTNRSAELNVYDPKTEKWDRKADMPEPRDRLALATLKGDLYAMGGEAPDGRGVNTVWRYSVSDNKWTIAARLSVARKNFTAVRVGDSLLVAGGWNIVDDEKVFPGKIEVYDPKSTKDWLSFGQLESPRDGCRGVAWRGRLLTFGGFNGDFVSSVEETHWRTRKSHWRLDEGLKLHLAFCADTELPVGPKVEEEKPLGFTPAASADVTDIGLEKMRALGFPLPARDNDSAYTVFLKFYQYPTQLGQEASVRRAMAPFLVSGPAAGQAVEMAATKNTEVVVKKAVIEPSSYAFGPQHPFPPLRVPTEALSGAAGQSVTPQEYFDGAVAFSSMYVQPSQPIQSKADARASAQGVVAYGDEARAVLARSYRVIGGSDAKYTFFLDDSERDQAGDDPIYTVIRVPKQVEVFDGVSDDYHHLPMPQDPAHMFLSGLLVMSRADYSAPAGPWIDAVADLKNPPLRSSVLEIGSVVRLR